MLNMSLPVPEKLITPSLFDETTNMKVFNVTTKTKITKTAIIIFFLYMMNLLSAHYGQCPSPTEHENGLVIIILN